jgi:S1-C subfamily serine protease
VIRLGEWLETAPLPLRDGVEAYKWFNIAAGLGRYDGEYFAGLALKEKQALAARLSPSQIEEAQHRSKAYLTERETREHSQAEDPGRSVDPAKGTGSGFFVTEDGYLCTSFHVVEKATRIIVRTKTQSLPATLISRDAANDLAIIKVVGRFRAVPVAASRGVQLGEPVFTIGFPNTGIQGIEPKLTRGEVSSLCGIQDDPRHFQISVPVQPGNSGGPLINLRGNVIGIVRLRLDDEKTLEITGSLPQNVNYAVKSSFVLALLESVPGMSAKVKEPHPPKERKFEGVVNEAQEAAALVLVY